LPVLLILEHLLGAIDHVFQLGAIGVPPLKAKQLKALSSLGTHGTRGTPRF
jgi:hypothetical protein